MIEEEEPGRMEDGRQREGAMGVGEEGSEQVSSISLSREELQGEEAISMRSRNWNGQLLPTSYCGNIEKG